jgi:hypothetical protein
MRILEKMIENKTKLRPSCDQVLGKISDWAINYEENKNDSAFSKFIDTLNPNEPLKLESFHRYYFSKKNKYLFHKIA